MAITKVTRTLLSTGIVDNSNATAITIDSSENVGIGTSSPSQPLTVSKAGDLYIQVNNSSAGFNTYLGTYANESRIVCDGAKPIAFFVNGSRVVDFANGGNVGIGLTNPTATLDVNGTIKLDGNYPTGTNNVALGNTALDSLTSGGYNTAIGSNALTANTEGSANVAVGYISLDALLTGNYNVAVGSESLTDLTTGSFNTAVGDGAAANTTTASNNSAFGSGSLLTNLTGADNTGIGKDALRANTTADNNTAVGSKALQDSSTGGSNTALGYASLFSNTTASNNVAVGASSLESTTTGYNNTAVGHFAGKAITGHSNTCIGQGAGESVTSGNENILIGHNVENNSAGAAANIVIGNDIFGAGTNTVRIGTSNGSATLNLDGSDTSWAATSDERLKKDIADSTVGLNFIKDLRPVTFKWNAKDAVASSLPQYDASSSDPVYGTGNAHHGFIAQEVKTVIDAHSDVANGHNIWVEDPDGTQQVAPSALIPMLVKSIQEQQTIIDDLKTRIETLESA